MTCRLLAIFATMILPSGSQIEQRTGTVTFLIIDQSGRALAGWKVSAFKSNTKENAPQFSGLVGKQIATDFYRYVLTGPTVTSGVASPWTPSLAGQIEVFRPEVFVVRTATNDVLTGISIDRN